MTQETDEPPSTITSPAGQSDVRPRKNNPPQNNERGFFAMIKTLIKPKSDPTLRETIEEYIEDEAKKTEGTSITAHEKTLIENVLDFSDMCASDFMVPRADIIAIAHDITQADLLSLLAERQYSRMPVYKDTLDNVIGAIHVKDILAALARGETVNVQDLAREIPIISPSMQAVDLLLQMRLTKKHMVLVIDEFGGIDGLITIGDVIETIVGEIDDEHDPDDQPEILTQTNGTILADARVDLEEFEEQFGDILTEEERNENDTLGGLVFSIAGRVPARGEILTHQSGMEFEVLDADPRRVNRLCIRNVPSLRAAE